MHILIYLINGVSNGASNGASKLGKSTRETTPIRAGIKKKKQDFCNENTRYFNLIRQSKVYVSIVK